MNVNIASDSLVNHQADWLKRYQPAIRIKEQGKVVSFGDGIVWISGLPMAAIDDILAFEDGSSAMVFDLTETQVGAVLLHQTDALTSGSKVWLTGKPLSVPVGDTGPCVGRAVKSQGIPLDGLAFTYPPSWQHVEVEIPCYNGA